MLSRVRHFLELVRFSHTLFALPFALLSAAMAWATNARQQPPVAFRWLDLLGIVLCMVTARSAAMAFNRLADRQLDALNPRTCSRHLPRGTLSAAAVGLFTAMCALGFIGSTLLFLPHNPWPVRASLPVLLFLFAYSYAKRFTWLSHFWLGAALMLAPMAAWVAIRAELALPPAILGCAVLLWVAGFDVIYACQDYQFDRAMHLHSIPARFGIPSALRLAALCHVAMLVLLAMLAAVYPFGWFYRAGVALIGLLIGYEHWLVSPQDLSRVHQAFFHVNAAVSLGLLLAGMIDLLVYLP